MSRLFNSGYPAQRTHLSVILAFDCAQTRQIYCVILSISFEYAAGLETDIRARNALQLVVKLGFLSSAYVEKCSPVSNCSIKRSTSTGTPSILNDTIAFAVSSASTPTKGAEALSTTSV